MSTDFDIRIKRVYEPSESEDGVRVMVGRLCPRGIAKKAADLNMWLKDVAPTPQLRKWFGHDPDRFEEFSRRYRAELSDNAGETEKLAVRARSGPLTLIYSAHDPVHNHARMLAGFLRESLDKNGFA